MHEGHMDSQENRQSGFDWYKVGLWGAIAIIGYFLLTEHRAHVIQFLPIALLLACPLMHMFMHGGHGGHSHGSREQGQGGHKHGDDQKKEWK